jgi:hypothetical protein
MFARVMRRLALFSLALILVPLAVATPGCAGADGKAGKPEVQDGGLNDLAEKLIELDSASYILTVDDLDKFEAGRSRAEILEEVKWRVGSVLYARCDGKDVVEITIAVAVDPTVRDREGFFHALFVDDKFEKFIRWLPGTELDHNGTPAGQPKAGDECGWLTRALHSEAVSIADMKKEVASITDPPHDYDPGLTVAYYLLRSFGVVPGPDAPATKKEYLRNAALRDQFNAARLDLGMTKSEVEAVLNAKPLEEENVEAGTYQIYGGNESYNMDPWLHFSNIFVVYKKEIAIAISSTPAGYDWRRELGEVISDLPSPGDEE